MILDIPGCYSMCDLIKVSSIFTIAPCWLWSRGSMSYGAPMSCGARRDLALESVLGHTKMRSFRGYTCMRWIGKISEEHPNSFPNGFA
jgi:hypothetical protein